MTRDGKRISFHRNRNIRTSKARDEETINAFPDPGSQKGSGRREVEKLLQQNKLLFFHKKIDLVGRAFYSKGIHFIGKERVVVDQAQPTRKRGSPRAFSQAKQKPVCAAFDVKNRNEQDRGMPAV